MSRAKVLQGGAVLAVENETRTSRRRARMRPVRLVAPIVENSEISASAGPASGHEQVRKAVKFEIHVKEDYRKLRCVHLVKNEGWLRSDTARRT